MHLESREFSVVCVTSEIELLSSAAISVFGVAFSHQLTVCLYIIDREMTLIMQSWLVSSLEVYWPFVVAHPSLSSKPLLVVSFFVSLKVLVTSSLQSAQEDNTNSCRKCKDNRLLSIRPVCTKVDIIPMLSNIMKN